jgi:magnesium chelatase family protein
MVARVLTASINGLDAQPVTVEVDLSSGLPGLSIVGLPDTILNESRERVRSALRNASFAFPNQRVVVNLAPASLRKEGNGFDLPLSVGIVLANGDVAAPHWMDQALWCGELSLEGALQPAQGVLAMAMMAKAQGLKIIIVPPQNVQEAALVEGLAVLGLPHLAQLPMLLAQPKTFQAQRCGQALIEFVLDEQRKHPAYSQPIDFAAVKGQAPAKRALEIAAAGGHNLLMVGSPGSGKSLMAKAFASILPPMSVAEMLEVSRIYSVAGLLDKNGGLVHQRPFRSPHHSASMAGLTGGGSVPRPGEITLAHRGVLFLDELVEFPRNVLEIMRQPIEDGVVTISRANQVHTFPARFQLVAAMNPCPCGYLGDALTRCRCGEQSIERYQSRLSGPLLDRIDLHVAVPRLSQQELMAPPAGNGDGVGHGADSSGVIRGRVIAARERQKDRFAALKVNITNNADMGPALLQQVCQLDEPSRVLLAKAMERLNLSARAYDRLLRLSRTIADLAASEAILPAHVAEAVQYRGVSMLEGSPASA